MECLKIAYRASDEDVLLVAGIGGGCGVVRELMIKLASLDALDAGAKENKSQKNAGLVNEKRKIMSEAVEAAAAGMLARAQCLGALKREKAVKQITNALITIAPGTGDVAAVAVNVMRKARDGLFVNMMALELITRLKDVMKDMSCEIGDEAVEKWCRRRWEASERSWALLRVLEEAWPVVRDDVKTKVRKTVGKMGIEGRIDLVVEARVWRELVGLVGIDTACL